MNIRLLKNSSYPIQRAKGSAQKRLNRSSAQARRYFEKTVEYFKSGDVNLHNLEKDMLEVIDCPSIKVKFIGKKDAFSPSMVDFNRRSPFMKFVIATKETLVPIQSRLFGDIVNKNAETPNHEALHLFDLMNNPKFIARDLKLMKRKDYKRIEKFFIENVFCPDFEQGKTSDILSQIEKKVRRYLKQKSFEEKADILQDFRYHCLLENRAHRWGAKCQKTLGLAMKRNDDMSAAVKKANLFKKKFELFNKLLLETLQEERAKIAKQHCITTLP